MEQLLHVSQQQAKVSKMLEARATQQVQGFSNNMPPPKHLPPAELPAQASPMDQFGLDGFAARETESFFVAAFQT